MNPHNNTRSPPSFALVRSLILNNLNTMDIQ